MRSHTHNAFRIIAGALILGAVVHVGTLLPRVGQLARALPAGGWWIVTTYAISALTALFACALAGVLLWKAADRADGRALTLFLGFLALFWGSLFRFLEIESATRSVNVTLSYGDDLVGSTAILSVLLSSAAFLRFTALFPAVLTADRLPPARRMRWLRTVRAALLRARVIWPLVIGLMVVAEFVPDLVMRLLGLAPGEAPQGAQVPIVSAVTLGLAAVIYVTVPLLAIGLGAHNLVTSYRLAGPDERRRMLWVVAGSITAASLTFASLGIAASTAIIEMPPAVMGGAIVLLMFAPLAFVGSAAIAILSAGAIDPGLALQRSTVYGVLGALGVIAFAALENALSSIVEQRLGMPGFIGAMAAGGIVALALLPFRRPIQRAVTTRFATHD